MAEIWMGLKKVKAAIDEDRLQLVVSDMERNMQSWLSLSPLASVERMVAEQTLQKAPTK